MNQTEDSCKYCGKCCHYEIPLSLLDIHRIAHFLDVSDREAFKKYIQTKISHGSGLFTISKKKDSACVFLTDDKKCSVHDEKPNACKFYVCSLDSNKEVIPWTATCTTQLERAKLWEQSVASMVTKAYIKKNQTSWNDSDYYKSIISIYENIVLNDHQKIKLSRIGSGESIGMIYDCSQCKLRGTQAKETLITLDDIRRIVSYLDINWKNFFMEKIAPQISLSSGTLKLIRDNYCIFFDQEKHCTIEEVRPMHCRFTPCPIKTKSKEMFDCFYLGSGTVEEQFRHQVAMTMTREYVTKYGTRYNKNAIKEIINKIDNLASDQTELDVFCKKISDYRYVDDTLILKKNRIYNKFLST